MPSKENQNMKQQKKTWNKGKDKHDRTLLFNIQPVILLKILLKEYEAMYFI